MIYFYHPISQAFADQEQKYVFRVSRKNMFLSYLVHSIKHIVEHSSEVLLTPLNIGTARREDSPLGMLLPAPTERNIRQSYTPDVVPAK